MTFADRALPMIQRGIRVVPLLPKSKSAFIEGFLEKATYERSTVKKWAAEYPDANVGCVAMLDFCFLDDDAGTLAETIEKETGRGLPPTYTVKTAKGYHYYFHATGESMMLGNAKKAGVFDFQSDRKYVVGPYSVHPSGAIYTPLHPNASIADIPSWVVEWIANNRDGHDHIEAAQDEERRPLHDDFEIEDFLEWYDLSGKWEEDKFHLDECPFKGDYHTNGKGRRDSKATSIMYDGGTLGFKCLASSCEGSNHGIGGLIRHLNRTHEPYPDPIWEEDEDWQQKDIADSLHTFGAVEADSESTGVEKCYRRPPCACGKQHVYTAETHGAAVADAQNPGELVTVRASEVKMQKLEWLWLNFVPLGKITYFSGMPDCGKSVTTLDLVARVSSGRDFADGSPNKWGAREVLLAVSEDGVEDTVVPRLRAAGANMTNVHILQFVKPEPDDSKKKRMLKLSEDIGRIHRFLKANPQIILMAFDPITSYFGDVDANKDKEIRPVMDKLSELCDRTKTTFVAVMHLNKRSDVSAIHKILGASSVAGSARTAWGFSRDPENKELNHMSLIKNNLTKERDGLDYKLVTIDVEVGGEMVGHAAIQWIGKNKMTADEQMDHAKELKRQGKRGDLKKWLKEQIEKGNDKIGELIDLAEDNDIGSRATLYRAASELGLKTTSSKPKRWYFAQPLAELPDQPSQKSLIPDDGVL